MFSVCWTYTIWKILSKGWTVRGSNPDGGEIYLTPPDRPRGPPSLLYNGYRVFPGGKAAGAWCWPPTPSSVEVEGRVELYLYSPSGPSWSVYLYLYLYLYIIIILLLYYNLAFYVISGFGREVDEKCAILGHYAASSCNSLKDVSIQPISPIFNGQESKNLLYDYSLRNKSEERSSLAY